MENQKSILKFLWNKDIVLSPLDGDPAICLFSIDSSPSSPTDCFLYLAYWVTLSPSTQPPLKSVSLTVSHSVMPTLWDPMDCSPPGSSVHEISQTRILECVVISFSRGSTQGSKLGLLHCRQILYWLSYKGSPNLLLAMLEFPQAPSCPVCFSSLSSSLYCWNLRMLSTCLRETLLAWQVPGLSSLLSVGENVLVISASWSTSNLILRWCCESAALNMPANLENSAVATGLEKVSFHSNPKERQCQRMLNLPHNCTHLTR